MKPIPTQELRKIQIDILNHFVAFCNKNKLKYWIDYGTLLGAIRHKGYIPWDDDIDVSMLREDYDKLIHLYDNTNEARYKFLCPENDKLYSYPFGKVVDTNTILYEMGQNGIKLGVYIDVFVFDDAPKDNKDLKRMFKIRDYYGYLRRLQLSTADAPFSFKRAIVLMEKKLLKVVPRHYFNAKIARNARKYKGIGSGKVCDFSCPYPYSYSNWIVEKSIFQDFCEVEFEGKQYKAPKEYHKWLSIQYGDYMKIPPEGERIHHDIKAYYKE